MFGSSSTCTVPTALHIASKLQHVIILPARWDSPPMLSSKKTNLCQLLQYSDAETTTPLQLLQTATSVAGLQDTAGPLLLRRFRS